MDNRELVKDQNFKTVNVSGEFTTESVTLTGTAFTDNDVDIPTGAIEVDLYSADSAFEIAEAVDGVGFPCSALHYHTYGINKMDKIWLKGVNDQVVKLMWRYL